MPAHLPQGGCRDGALRYAAEHLGYGPPELLLHDFKGLHHTKTIQLVNQYQNQTKFQKPTCFFTTTLFTTIL